MLYMSNIGNVKVQPHGTSKEVVGKFWYRFIQR